MKNIYFICFFEYFGLFHTFLFQFFRNNVLELEVVSSTDKKCAWKRHKEPVLEQFKALPSETFCCIKPDRLPPLSRTRLAQIRKRLIDCDDRTAISKHNLERNSVHHRLLSYTRSRIPFYLQHGNY